MAETTMKPARIGTLELMFLIMFTLKLGLGDTGVMHFSWWLVCTPLIVTFILGLILGLLRRVGSAVQK